MTTHADRLQATYLIETPLDPAQVAEVMAGEQSCGTFTRVQGETDELRERARATVEHIEELPAASAPGLPNAWLERQGRGGPWRRARVRLSFPTANIATSSTFALAQGVYAVRARLGERLLDGVASFGKPMFNNELPPFETFLFDFDGDIYGRHLEIALVGHLRGQEVYKGLDELIAAIGRDSRKAREALGQCGPLSELDRTLGFSA